MGMRRRWACRRYSRRIVIRGRCSPRPATARECQQPRNGVTTLSLRSHRTLSPNDSSAMIEIFGLVKRYGPVAAVDHVDLIVETGEIFGILGPNGAGKTTTLEMIEGLRKPDEGSIRVAGIDAVAESDRVRKIIGVQLQTTALFDYLNATELIQLYAGLYGVDGSAARVEELLATVRLQDKRKARVEELSGGQRQRLSITLALVNRPTVVFLDEPTTGLDPGARRDLWQTVQDVRATGATVVLTTHYMEEAEILCDRVAVMDRGKVIANDTPAGLIRTLGSQATIQAHATSGALPSHELASNHRCSADAGRAACSRRAIGCHACRPWRSTVDARRCFSEPHRAYLRGAKRPNCRAGTEPRSSQTTKRLTSPS